jgi:hypothetical protein
MKGVFIKYQLIKIQNIIIYSMLISCLLNDNNQKTKFQG